MKKFIAITLLCAVCAVQGRNIMELENVDPKTVEDLQLNPVYIYNNTHFLLWTRRNPTDHVKLETGNEKLLKESGYDKNLPTKIFAHGFNMNGSSGEILKMRDEFLKREDCNYISVDWGKLAGGINYIRASDCTTPVGELTGQLINFLVEQGSDLKNFHVIGFSLGAHVAGKAGATVKGLLPRVTGLDPAYPLYTMKNTDKRLDTSDAEFVDVIHTNSGSLFQDSLSFPQAIGHIDFFVNGGHSQPGCGIISGDIIDLLSGCSHLRAPAYFTESINSQTGFKSTNCDTYNSYTHGNCAGNPTSLMGEPVTMTSRGTFYLTTNKKSPFAK